MDLAEPQHKILADEPDIVWVMGWSYIPGADNAAFGRRVILQRADGAGYLAVPADWHRADVEAILRRTNQMTEGEVLSYGGILIDQAAHVVTIDGKPIDLSFKEFELLTYFMENKGIALSREKILNSVWNMITLAMPGPLIPMSKNLGAS